MIRPKTKRNTGCTENHRGPRRTILNKAEFQFHPCPPPHRLPANSLTSLPGELTSTTGTPHACNASPSRVGFAPHKSESDDTSNWHPSTAASATIRASFCSSHSMI